MNSEFWILLSIYIVMHTLTFGIAALIYWKQQAFNSKMFGMVQAAIAEIKADIRNPATMQDVGKGIGQQIWAFIRSQMGNIAQYGGAALGQPNVKMDLGTAILTVLTGKGSIKKRLRSVAGGLTGGKFDVQDQGQGQMFEENLPGQPGNLHTENKLAEAVPESEKENIKKMKEFSEFIEKTLTPEQKAAIEKKRAELAKGI